MNSLGIIISILVYSFTLLGSKSDENPIGWRWPGGPDPELPQSYYENPAVRKINCVTVIDDPYGSNLDEITDPNRNGGRPFHNCRYAISTLKDRFYKIINIYYPCRRQEVVGIVRTGGVPFPIPLQVIKGYHETIATKFPLPIPNAEKGRPESLTVTGGLISQGFLLSKNTSVPFEWHKDENFYNGLQEKISIISQYARLYKETQLEQIISLHGALKTSFEHAENEIHDFNLNVEQKDRKELAPLIVTDHQSFSTPTTRIIEELLTEDYIQAERAFGFVGLRFEFQYPENVTERISKLISRGVRRKLTIRNLGPTPVEASANTVRFHNAFVDLGKRTQKDLITYLHDQAEHIMKNTTFNINVPSTSPPFCFEDIEVDPKNVNVGGSVNNQVGMGSVG